MGERAVDYNAAFKLYLVTRNATPALSPDVVPLLTVTNFSITRSGLEGELRGLRKGIDAHLAGGSNHSRFAHAKCAGQLTWTVLSTARPGTRLKRVQTCTEATFCCLFGQG